MDINTQSPGLMNSLAASRDLPSAQGYGTRTVPSELKSHLTEGEKEAYGSGRLGRMTKEADSPDEASLREKLHKGQQEQSIYAEGPRPKMFVETNNEPFRYEAPSKTATAR